VVKAQETDLAGVLEGKKQYQVPLYQRVFSWRRKQLEQLWDDIVELADARREAATTTHFIGSLVLASNPGNAAVGVAKYLVVDGQQRLTSLTILLAALRDQLVEAGHDERAQGIDAQYLINPYDVGKPSKVLPTQADREAYLAVIRRAPSAGADDPLGEAYNFFRTQIAAADDADDPHGLEAIESAIVRGLALVAVTAESGDNVHRIFESLNNTGLRLSQSDLLKNYLFMRLGERSDLVYESVWLPLEQRLDTDGLELLFWLDLVQSDERAKQSDTYVGQQRRLERFQSAEEIESEVRRIARLGEVLATVLEPSREPDPQIRERLSRIKAWGSTTAYPIVMTILQRHEQGTATDEQVINALTVLESYFVRRIIIGRATANLNRTLLQGVSVVAEASAIDVGLRDYLSQGRKYFATDEQVREAATTVQFYWQGRASQKKLILQWIEESYGAKEVVDSSNLTIEHVLPQTLTGETRDELAAGLPEGADISYEHERLVDTLGNLTLTGYNSELSNRSFAQKREMLAQSGIRMNQEIAAHATWSEAEITERSAALAERIIRLWPGPNESVVSATSVSRPASGLAATVAAIASQIPAGRWTTYGEVAIVAGSYPQPVAAVITAYPIRNAWRVLQVGGAISPGFRWNDGRTETPREVLEAEGLRFDGDGRADPQQFISGTELAELGGLGVEEADDPANDDESQPSAPGE